MDRTSFENVFGQVGFCGIWCGSCAVGTSALIELAGRYRELCESHGLGHWGADDFDYDALLKGRDSISGLPVCRGCLQGGGRADCEMRACATGRALRGCSFCPDVDDCQHAAALEHMRSGARRAKLLVAETAEEHDLSAARRRRELVSLWWRALFSSDE